MVKPVRIDIGGDGMFMNLRPTLSTAEAAKALGVTCRVARGYVTQELLVAVQVGRAYRVRTESVERLLTLGTAKVRAELAASPEGSGLIPSRDDSRERFRARLVKQMLDRDAEQAAYTAPIF